MKTDLNFKSNALEPATPPELIKWFAAYDAWITEQGHPERRLSAEGRGFIRMLATCSTEEYERHSKNTSEQVVFPGIYSDDVRIHVSSNIICCYGPNSGPDCAIKSRPYLP